MFAPLFFVAALARVQMFVSPDGSDSWSGTLSRPNESRTDGPLASIQASRDKLRAVPKDVPARVEIESGTYRIESPIAFGPEDSGVERVYEGRGVVTISGLVPISSWHALPNGYLRTTVPQVKAGTWYFSQLFVNGERRYRPRLPKSGYYTVAEHEEPSAEAKGHGFDRFGFAPGEIREDWANRGDVELLAFHLWTMSRNRIRSIDNSRHVVSLKAPTGYDASWADFAKGGRYLVENVKEGLSEPGEWYLDRPTGELTYIPRTGESADSIHVEAPIAERLVEFDGDPQTKNWVHGITLRNLRFEGGNWNLSANGRHFPQAEADLSGEISLQGARNCSIESCRIEHTGEYAVEIGHACQSIRVAKCLMQDLAAGGVKVGEQAWERDPELQTSHCEIDSNVINGGGRIHPAAVGVWIGQNPFINVTENTIHDFYYTGISVGWSWGYQPDGAHDNRIENNRISQIGQGVLSDMGGIYTLGVQPNTVLHGNRIHDVVSFSYGGWGIYPDEGSSGILIEDNCVFRCKSAGFHQHYGRANKVVNNVFALNGDAQIMRTRAEEHLSFAMEHNIVYWNGGAMLGSNWSGNNYLLDWNCYWRADAKPIDFAGLTLDAWRAKGQDRNSIVSDPLFFDPGHGDFRTKPESPARRLGFHEFPALRPAFEGSPLEKVPAAFK